MAAAKRRGKQLGRPAALSAEALERVRELRALGRSHREIARELGCSSATVCRALGRLRGLRQAA